MGNKRFSNKKGITLIALIVTIIIMLILLGVTIGGAVLNGGLFDYAKKAKIETEVDSEIERIRLIIMQDNLDDEAVRQLLIREYEEIKKDSEGEEYIVTEKGYHIKVAELLGKVYEGKLAYALYDGNNNWKDTENYNDDGMHIGDYVNYTAGSWEETKETPTASFGFGGYSANQSKDIGVTSGTTYQGWRIWDISEDKNTVTLISAACPEMYFHPFSGGVGYNSEKILTGETSGAINASYTSTPRNWNDDYKNIKYYANNARAFTKVDLDLWYNKYINSECTDTATLTNLPSVTSNKFMPLVIIGSKYWLSNAQSNNNVYTLDKTVSNYRGAAYGVRILIELEENVRFDPTPERIVQNGFTYNKWSIIPKK